MKKKNITTLNINENYITCSVCSFDDKGGIVVLGTSSVPAKGIEGGSIADLSEVASSISQAIEKTETASRVKAISLLTSCDGVNIKGYNTKGSITIAEKENEISRRDINRVTEAAKTIALPFDREIIHSIIRSYVLDGQDGIKDPSGMFGTRLEVDMEIVTVPITNLHNLRRSINTAGFEIRDVVLSGIAAGQMVLEDLEKDLGVILVYITYSSTHIVVYNDGEIKSIEVIPMGSGALVEALAVNYKIPRDYAENLLNRDASLDKSTMTEDDKIILRIGQSHLTILKSEAYDTVLPKAEEIILKISGALKKMPFAKEATAGCVVSGELANLAGFIEMLQLSLSMPVKMGLVKGVSNQTGELVTVASPGQIVCFGLVKYWAKEGARKVVRKNIFGNNWLGKLINRAGDVFSDYF